MVMEINKSEVASSCSGLGCDRFTRLYGLEMVLPFSFNEIST